MVARGQHYGPLSYAAPGRTWPRGRLREVPPDPAVELARRRAELIAELLPPPPVVGQPATFNQEVTAGPFAGPWSGRGRGRNARLEPYGVPASPRVGPSPPPPPPPATSNGTLIGISKTLITRIPDAEPRARRNTEILASVVNSLQTQGLLRQTGLGTWTIAGATIQQTRPPTAADDVNTVHAAPGQAWLDTVTGSLYFCMSAAAGAAVWKRATLT